MTGPVITGMGDGVATGWFFFVLQPVIRIARREIEKRRLLIISA
jgi:hypothetical protein